VKDKISSHEITEILKIPAFWITLVLVIGFVLSPGAADVDAMKSTGSGLDAGGKLIRVVSAVLAGSFALLSLFQSNALSSAIKGNLGILLVFICLAYFSVVFSQLRTMTIYKSSELVVMLFIAATLYGRSVPFVESRRYLTGLFWIYLLTAISVLLQLAYYGPGIYKQIYSTPFISFMLSSRHPPLAANSVGLLGAFVAMFGVYLFYNTRSKKKLGYAIAVIIGMIGMITLVLSYTRSALVLFVFAGAVFLFFNRKYILLTFAAFCMVALLTVGSARNLVDSHLRRGDSEQNIATLSSRAVLWNHILQKDSLRLIIGEGYATGTLFQDFREDGSGRSFKIRNAHNSILEIINSTGVIGAFVWIIVILRINFQLFRHLIRVRHAVDKDEYMFHLFVSCVFLLSSLRSFMNSTFVYLDYFLPVLFAVAVYADTLTSRRNMIAKENSASDHVSEDDIDELDDKENISKQSILSYKKSR